MSDDPDQTRRWLISASGAAILSSTLPLTASNAQAAAPARPARVSADDATIGANFISPVTRMLADYVAKTLDRELPAAVLAATKLHVLDTIAAIVFGSRLKPGEVAVRYVDSLGGKPRATVIGTRIVTSTVNAAFANAMMGHADEADDAHDTHFGFHPGVNVVPAALATAEHAGRTGNDVLRAVALGYDVGARSPGSPTFAATAAAAALLRLSPAEVRYAFSYAGQQASGIGNWDHDPEHIEKAFFFGGMGARNGVTAATLVAIGATAEDDPFSGIPSVFTALGRGATPEALVAELGTRFEIINTSIKKWGVGMSLEAVLDSVTVLMEDHAVRAGNIKRIVVEIPAVGVEIFDNSPSPDLCAQHVVALMIVDHGVTFRSTTDVARMRDPKVLAIRKLVELVPSQELQRASTPARQAIVTIETVDGRSLSHRTYMVRGMPSNPMGAKEVEAKALDLTAPVLGAARAKELIAALSNLDRFGPVSGLRPLLQA